MQDMDAQKSNSFVFKCDKILIIIIIPHYIGSILEAQ